MKLKFFFVCFLSCLWTTNSWAVDNGWRTIKSHGEVRCGTNLNAKTYAYKDENGYWHGIDADVCRVLSAAIFGRTDKFKLVDVKPYQISNALLQNKIDVMLGETAGTASSDIESPITQAALLYYTRQMFLAHKNNNATSMKDFKGKKICIVPDNTDYFVFQSFNDKYYKDLILDYIKNFGKATRQEIEQLVKDKLSQTLSEQQKTDKITNLLAALRKEKKIKNLHRAWFLVK